MSHSAVKKKIDKIVSKLANKPKDIKLTVSDITDYHSHEDASTDDNSELQQGKNIQRMKHHIEHTSKAQHDQHPTSQILSNSLLDSSLKSE
ncbi:unnamed protein product [Rotaria magnacalcarata]|uniref:Uncharacterized protein n=1 Tax=Rotaria magnacalcarata TaxID=392030 RepID=A0A819M9W9_9BILA|nr:unnamed protein product [Rotaria magnacalcarata]CAF3916658.1 unnamed protein product [Rotaria magnacalcarata]CAF3976948.1 unnamed protein product [Rotaria magnacalcarata]CAF4111510.1 unnamed protein product [Rotaria magnacalcarata]CAF4190259.1 unnamed protein product [Rotaria magnacalcarata]